MGKMSWLPDVSILIGAVLFSTGLYMIYPPTMFIGLGIFFIYIGWPKGNPPKKKVK